MNLTNELENLQRLHAEGALTEAEYIRAKAIVMQQFTNLPALPTSPAQPLSSNTLVWRRSTRGKVLGGVCAGLGKTSHTPAWLWRAGFAFFALTHGIGGLVYLLLWIFLPNET